MNTKIDRFWLILFSVIILVNLKVSVWAQLHLPLEVTDYSGIDRLEEPLTSGIPLPLDKQIYDVNKLNIKSDKGNAVSAQFTVTSRWNGTPDDITKPIKWILADFKVDVRAGQSSRYYLTDTGSINYVSTLNIDEQADKIIVNTGKVRFVISKNHFNLFDAVYVDSENGGDFDDLLLKNDQSHGLVLTDKADNKYSTTFEPPEEITIEKNGAQRAVINIRGVFKDASGGYFAPSICRSDKYPNFCQPYSKSFFYYNCRIHFYENKSYARVFITIENNGANGNDNPEKYFAPDQTVYFDSLELKISPYGFATPSIKAEGVAEQISQGASVSIYQDWNENLGDNYRSTLDPLFREGPFYTIKKNGSEIHSGKQSEGWFSMAENEKSSICFSMRHFWQNFPKQLTVDNSLMKIGFWPEQGYYPYTPEAREAGTYLFAGGRHKTFEFILGFGMKEDESEQISLKLEKPLMALAPAGWYAGSNALGIIAPAYMQHDNDDIAEAISRYEKHARAMVYESDSDDGATITNIKTAQYPDYEYKDQRRFFSWMGFGDLLWAGPMPCALHYDWPYSMLLHYLRTGKRAFFDVAVAMAKHRYDVDQYHGEREALNGSAGNHKWSNHVAFYESDGHADPSITSYKPSRISKPSHTWNGGLVLYYLLTGDLKAWEAADENGQLALNYYGPTGVHRANKKACAGNETRQETWSMLNLVNLYRVNGDPELYQTINNIAKNRLLYREELAGESGHFGGGNPPTLNPDVQSSTMYAYAIEPLIYSHYVTGDDELKSLLIRMADWTWSEFLFGGESDEAGLYMPLQCVYVWKKHDPTGIEKEYKGEVIKGTFWADLFAYVYSLTDDEKYLKRARHCFKDGMFYPTAPGSKFLNPSYRSGLTFDDSMFPGSHTKIHGWLLRTNQVYLHTEWMLTDDYDQDGMPNDWEEKHGLDLYLDDSKDDYNNDGISNIDEFRSNVKISSPKKFKIN